MSFNYKINFSSSCPKDLDEYVKNASKYSIQLSRKIKEEFYSKISYLQEYPRMYQTIKIINQKEIRKIVISKYVILYSINNNIINILNVYPQKSNYINLIKI